MLLTSAAFQDHRAPSNWCGRIIGSAEDVARFQSVSSKSNQGYKFDVLKPNEPTEIVYDNTKIMLTLIPAGQNEDNENAILYYLKSWCLTSIHLYNTYNLQRFVLQMTTSVLL